MYGKQSIGRQKTRWMDGVAKTTGLTTVEVLKARRCYNPLSNFFQKKKDTFWEREWIWNGRNINLKEKEEG